MSAATLASVAALKKFPEFNSSLDGEQLVFKQYYHVGFAADTPNGLVVPVIKDADKKGILQISQEMSELASSDISWLICRMPFLSASLITGTTSPLGVSAAKPTW